jgi:hypothetical protein
MGKIMTRMAFTRHDRFIMSLAMLMATGVGAYVFAIVLFAIRGLVVWP